MFGRKSKVVVLDLGTIVKYRGFSATYKVVGLTLYGGDNGNMLQLDAVSEELYGLRRG